MFAHSQTELTMEEWRQVTIERALKCMEYDFLPEEELIADPRLVRPFLRCIDYYL